MNVYQPKEMQAYGYDNTYLSFDRAGTLIFGYDARANWFTTFNIEALPGTAVKVRQFTGKERDQESGLDYFGARYYGSGLGRFTSPDPSRLSAFLDKPQTWNMYIYGNNNPFSFVDKNGRWPTSIHNQIIDNAFPNLTAHQRQILKDVSANQGGIWNGGQSGALSFQHAMRGPGQSVEEAKAEYEAFVSQNEDMAFRTQMNFWAAGNPGLSDDALAEFAAALHAIEDSTSPAHAGFQVWE